MNAAIRKEIEQKLAAKLGFSPLRQERAVRGTIPSGIPGLNLRRGALSEICGSPSSGMTSLLLAIMAAAASRDEAVALVDATSSFSPHDASSAGVDLDNVLWIRCESKLEEAFKCADLVLQGGGFGLVALDLADVRPEVIRKVPSNYWYRFRSTVEHTPTVFLVLSSSHCAGSSASVSLNVVRTAVSWTGSPSHLLLAGIRSRPAINKNHVGRQRTAG